MPLPTAEVASTKLYFQMAYLCQINHSNTVQNSTLHLIGWLLSRLLVGPLVIVSVRSFEQRMLGCVLGGLSRWCYLITDSKSANRVHG
jgi:hypothetical protein